MKESANSPQSRKSRKQTSLPAHGAWKAPSSPVEPRSLGAHTPARLTRRDGLREPFPQREAAPRSGAVSSRSERSPAVDPSRIGAAAPLGNLDTTAQPCQSPASSLRKRARKKWLTATLAEGLGRLTSPLSNAYRNTQRCGAVLRQEGGKLSAKYCGNRWCLVCNSIRTAKLFDAYGPTLRSWGDAHFVTLTIPNVNGARLHGAVREMLAELPKIVRGIRRTDRLDVKAVRKLETTYNPKRRDFHPHLHLVVNSGAVAAALVRRWLERFPEASERAQHIEKCDSGAIAELFKYFTKLTVKGLDGQHTAPPPHALDTIFRAVRGLRMFQAMGFVAPKAAVEADDELLTLDVGTVSPSRRREALVDWEWSGELTDWIDYSTGEVLSGYEPSEKMRGLVSRIVQDWAGGDPPEK